VGGWEQSLDAIRSVDELKNLAEDLGGADWFDSFAGGGIITVIERTSYALRCATCLFVVSAADMVGGERGLEDASDDEVSPFIFSELGGPCVNFVAQLWKSCCQNCQGHVREKFDLPLLIWRFLSHPSQREMAWAAMLVVLAVVASAFLRY